MNLSSINIAPVKASSSKHLDREQEQEHINKDLTKNNENWTAKDYINPNQYRAILEKNCKEKTKRAMQKKATPIREAVLNCNADTSLKDIKALCEKFKSEFGITAKKISVHKDEGQSKSKEHINYHCHIVFDWQNHDNGKSIKLNRDDMIKMQDITAETLKMQRGISSNKKHLDVIAYKTQQESLKVSKIKELAHKNKETKTYFKTLKKKELIKIILSYKLAILNKTDNMKYLKLFKEHKALKNDIKDLYQTKDINKFTRKHLKLHERRQRTKSQSYTR